MDEVDGFWAGAMRWAGSFDLPAAARAAGGWSALRSAGAEGLVAAGLPEERARAWCEASPFMTQGVALTLADARYPAGLRRMRTPPPVVLVEGAAEAFQQRAIAIVGTRACTAYGSSVARHLASSCAKGGLVVVSGLARGIDGEAHRAAMAVGRTVAVVAHGLGHTSPPSHRRLREELVAKGGAVLSTWPDDEEARPWYFPERNTWIAGLSEVVVVVEAPLKSGALITARAALAEGREVAAVPGPLGAPASAGCLELLEEGAAVVGSVERFVGALVGELRAPEGWIVDLFAGVGLDEVARRRGSPVTELLAELTRLEVEGRVVRGAGGRYLPGGRAG